MINPIKRFSKIEIKDISLDIFFCRVTHQTRVVGPYWKNIFPLPQTRLLTFGSGPLLMPGENIFPVRPPPTQTASGPSFPRVQISGHEKGKEGLQTTQSRNETALPTQRKIPKAIERQRAIVSELLSMNEIFSSSERSGFQLLNDMFFMPNG